MSTAKSTLASSDHPISIDPIPNLRPILLNSAQKLSQSLQTPPQQFGFPKVRFAEEPIRIVRDPIAKSRPLLRKPSLADDELRNFRHWLRWMCVDQTAVWSTVVSWIVFLMLGVVVPAFSHFVLSYDESKRTYDTVVEVSLTAVATLSFVCLSAFVKKYGLRRFLFLDKLVGESEMVRNGYTSQLTKSFKILSFFVLPTFAAETCYKVWWYLVGVDRIPFLGNPIISDIVMFTMEMCSWLYRTSTFFLVCVLFRLICRLQILRLQDFASVFQEESDVASILAEHLRIRRQLRVISHRFRMFILASLVLVTFSQLASLLLTTKPSANANIFNAGELAVCSVVLVNGLLICLRSAAKITHKAQAITSHAAKWHVCATIDAYDNTETPRDEISGAAVRPVNGLSDDDDDDDDVEEGDDDDLEDTMILHPHSNTLSFQKRQALVKYLEHNNAGITVYGFMLDRAWLRMIFGVELTLFLWLLQKTIGIS